MPHIHTKYGSPTYKDLAMWVVKNGPNIVRMKTGKPLMFWGHLFGRILIVVALPHFTCVYR